MVYSTMSLLRSKIIIAPFSNSEIRDWPVAKYSSLIGLLLDRAPPDETIHVVGTADQRLSGSEIVRRYTSTRVINQCGRLAWPRLIAAVREAACVIGNNSGIPHLAAHLGAPTICVFGGSHQRLEWRPRGFNVAVISRAIGCSPCHLDHQSSSPYGKACLRDIEPATVADVAMLMIARVTVAERDMRGLPTIVDHHPGAL